MTLEACVVVLDNTEYARNGDYPPNRFDAQADAIPIILSSKQQLNQENSIGLMTMGGSQVEVLVTPNKEQEVVLGKLYGIQLKGEKPHFVNALAISQLALKHRQNKNQRQRIMIFVASPIQEDEKQLTDIAKQLKKNKVSVDIINMYQKNEIQGQKLQKFIETVNSGDTSHFLNIQSGSNLTDCLISSPILNLVQPSQVPGDQGVPVPGPFDEYGGVDPEKDPELAMVIKQSLEEEKRRRELEAQQQAQQQNQQAQQQQQTQQQEPQQQQPQQQEKQQQNNQMEEEERGLLDNNDDMEFADDVDDEELLRKAIEESMKPNPILNPNNQENKEKKQEESTPAQIQNDLLQDPDFINDLLDMVDPKQEKKDENKDQKK